MVPTTSRLPLKSATNGTSVTVLDRILSIHGIPGQRHVIRILRIIRVLFTTVNRTRQNTSAPPSIRGQAECFVDTLKRALFKENWEVTTEEELQLFLLAYRTTPHPVLGEMSPAEMLMGR